MCPLYFASGVGRCRIEFLDRDLAFGQRIFPLRSLRGYVTRAGIDLGHLALERRHLLLGAGHRSECTRLPIARGVLPGGNLSLLDLPVHTAFTSRLLISFEFRH